MGLNNAAENYKAFVVVQEMIRYVVSAQLNQPCSQEALAETYRFLASNPLVLKFVIAVRMLIKKSKKT